MLCAVGQSAKTARPLEPMLLKGAWEAVVLPLNYARNFKHLAIIFRPVFLLFACHLLGQDARVKSATANISGA